MLQDKGGRGKNRAGRVGPVNVSVCQLKVCWEETGGPDGWMMECVGSEVAWLGWMKV